MAETPRDALERFIAEIEKSQLNDPPYEHLIDAFRAGMAALRPFISNPDRYEQTVKMILWGIAVNVWQFAILHENPEKRWRWYRLLNGLVPFRQRAFEEWKHNYLNSLASARDDLLRSLTPGRLEIDILPPKVTDAGPPGFRMVEIQVNVDVSPAPEFPSDALSVRLEAVEADVQFSTVSPTTRVESIGSFENSDMASIKDGVGRRRVDRLSTEVGGVGAKVGAEVASEETDNYEYQLTTSRKVSGQQYTPLIIGSAIKGVAYWQLLASSQQPLRGGLSFFATAYVPGQLTAVTIGAEVIARLAGFGDHRTTELKRIDLSP
jgi:hypothetical protein